MNIPEKDCHNLYFFVFLLLVILYPFYLFLVTLINSGILSYSNPHQNHFPFNKMKDVAYSISIFVYSFHIELTMSIEETILENNYMNIVFANS